ncbi:hypothetical protein COU36_01780 [Candidatus Micrarchaeota archaeon CG10_big_fil_rev_8_21_14_0_10_59_7]|nr:MAG: hypothetical protein COU36_01780 [Candidatus Micrarchaeota archaeon CG10_big_fil_rev_8_21_14_0_10_59_7]
MKLLTILLSSFVLISPFVIAQQCWEMHTDPGDWGTHYYWLCVSGLNRGWIYSVSPSGYQYGGGRMFKVELQSFTYSSPYPATLNCYEQFTDVEPPGRMGGKSGFGMLNSVPQGPLYSWHYLAQVTLNSGQGTSPSSSWVLAGCPPIMNSAQQGGSPPQVRITLSWSGVGGGRATAIAAPDYISIGVPFVGYLGGYIDALAGRTASALKTKRARR